MSASSDINPTMMTIEVISGMGLSQGIAARLSLPNIGPSWGGHPGRRARSCEDCVEQTGADGAEDPRRLLAARPRKLRVLLEIERAATRMALLDPSAKSIGRHRSHLKAHVGESVAAELRRQAGKSSRILGQKIQLGRHAGHGVDLTAELRHEKAVHDARRSEAKMQRRADRHDQAIDGGKA